VPAEYPDVPLNDPAYANFDLLDIYRGIDKCYPDPPSAQRRAMTRYEFAIAVARLCGFPSDFSDPLTQEKSQYEKLIHSAISKLKPSQLAATARLFAQFKPDLQQLGIAEQQIEFAQKELAARVESTPSPKPPIAAPFRDVPKTHWAFEAVERLRQSGIVIGTPDGAFAK
jgi:hypothetical protein